MMDQETERQAAELTDLMFDFVDLLLEDPDAELERVVGLPEVLSKDGRARYFEDIDIPSRPTWIWYPTFGKHEWEDKLFLLLAEYTDIIIASVVSPVAVSIVQDELKASYRWARTKVLGAIQGIATRYTNKNVTVRGEIQRFDDLKKYIDKGMETLERTGINDFTTKEFVGLTGIAEELVPSLLILCQLRERDGHWTRSGS